MLCYFSLRFDKESYVDNSGMRVIVGHYVGGGSGGILSDGNDICVALSIYFLKKNLYFGQILH